MKTKKPKNGKKRKTARRVRAAGVAGVAAPVAAASLLAFPPFWAWCRRGYSGCMGLLQQPVQKKLSKLLGAEVTFEKLNVSVLGGSIEARGMTIAGDDPSLPVLTVARLKAEISIPRALKKEIVVKSLTIERPVLNVVRRADGRTNLPKPLRVSDDEPGADDDHAPEPGAGGTRAAGGNGHPDAHPDGGGRGADTSTASEDDAAASGAWKLEAQKVLLVDGELHLRLEQPGGGGAYHLSAERILADVAEADGGLNFTCIIESAGRRDRPAELGEVKFTGRAERVQNLSQLSEASVTARLDLAEHFKAEVNCPSLKPPEVEIKARGAIDVAAVLPLFPPAVAALLRGASAAGRVELDFRASYDTARGLRAPELNVRGTDLAIAPVASEVGAAGPAA